MLQSLYARERNTTKTVKSEGTIKSDGFELATRRTHRWVDEFPGAITVCDSAGVILEMNRKSADSLRDQGGKKLIGTSLMNCHPEPARSKLKRLMKKRQTNVYTITKGRTRKIILQAPWYRRRKHSGFVEISLQIHGKIPNFVRKL
jgi:hypothetical protein